MSLYVLDTDILTLYEHGHPAVLQHVGSHPPWAVTTTIITVEEQITGWCAFVRKARRPDEIATAYRRFTEGIGFMGGLQLLSYTEAAVLRFGQLRAQKLNVGAMDLRIAAIVLENAAILVTPNLRDFRRIPGLTIEDWSV